MPVNIIKKNSETFKDQLFSRIFKAMNLAMGKKQIANVQIYRCRNKYVIYSISLTPINPIPNPNTNLGVNVTIKYPCRSAHLLMHFLP